MVGHMRPALTVVNILEKISPNRANSPQLGGVCIVAKAHHTRTVSYCVP
jgi:hypothetical protein